MLAIRSGSLFANATMLPNTWKHEYLGHGSKNNKHQVGYIYIYIYIYVDTYIPICQVNIANVHLSTLKCLLGELLISLKHLNYTKIPV